MNWEQNPENLNKTLENVLKNRFSEFENEKTVSEYYKIPLMKDACKLIMQFKNKVIRVIGDYDVDGITSSTSLTLILRDIGVTNFKIRLPKRFSEGYGLSQKIVEEILNENIEPGLIILVDNGISAVSAVEILKKAGWKVLILDHHIANKDLGIPDADILIDPHAGTESTFVDYCGAGLVYKLAQYMKSIKLLSDNAFLKISSLACIGTIADSVKLIEENDSCFGYDNYIIVRDGLKNLLKNEARTTGLYALLRAANLDYSIDEDKIAYTLAPIINASGRLYDDGATKVYELLAMDGADINSADAVSLELIEINQKRKDMTADALFDVYAIIEHNHMENDYPLIVYKEDLHPGLVGLIAGNLSEKYRTNVFVFSKKENNILTGSGRGLSRLFHLKETLDCASDLLLGYGGHAQAAGLSLIEDNLDKFVSIMKTLAGEKPLCPRYYDFEANTEDIKQAIDTFSVYKPFGTGNECPVFKVPFNAVGRNYYSVLGNTGKVLKISGKKVEAIEFSGKGIEQFSALKYPRNTILYGKLNLNFFMGQSTCQIIISDMIKNNYNEPKLEKTSDTKTFLQSLLS